MSPENSLKLMEIYPALFSGNSPIEPFSMFGFECDDGWFDLLKDLICEIKSICESGNAVAFVGLNDELTQLNVYQIKEKYGTLLVCTSWTNEKIDVAIDRAEKKSEETCELCGKEGNHCTVYAQWYKTVCEACRKEYYS